jgi:acyl carrier protein
MSLSEIQIIDGVAEVARRHLDWNGELRPETRLVEDLELDSLKTLTLALEVENFFRVCLDEEAEILTVGDLVTIIRGQLDE